MPYLIYCTGDEKEAFELNTPSETTFGRTSDNDVVILEDSSISRKHCLIRVFEDGSASIEDLGSRNGTSLDGAQLDDKPLQINDGSMVKLGNAEFIVCHSDFEKYAERDLRPVKLKINDKASTQQPAPPQQPPSTIMVETVNIDKSLVFPSSQQGSAISPDNLTLSKGTEIGGYRLIREIGESFYGKTFLAYQKSVDRTVALKVFSILQDHDQASAFDSLKKELFKTANVDHPGIMHYFDCGMQSNHIFLSMPYLSEGNLAARIAKQGNIPLEQMLDIATRTAETLNAMLKISGGLHLSLNPSNIVFNDNSDMLLCEYGIKPWKMKFCIKNESATNWSRYDSPEIRNAESASHLSDIYSFGVLLSEMLSGLSAGKQFDREAALGIKGSPELVELIRMTTEESPALRAQTYEAILKVLQHLRKKHARSIHAGRAQDPARLIKPPLQIRKIAIKHQSQR